MQKAASVAGAVSGAGGELAGQSSPWIAALMNMTPMTSRMYGAYKKAQAGNMGLADRASTRSLLAGLLDPSGGSDQSYPYIPDPTEGGKWALMPDVYDPTARNWAMLNGEGAEQPPTLSSSIAAALSGDSNTGGFNSFDPSSTDMGPGLSKMPAPPSTLPAEIQAASRQQAQPRQLDTRTLLRAVLGLAGTGGMSPKEAMDMGLRSTGNTEAIAGRSQDNALSVAQRQAAAQARIEEDSRHNKAFEEDADLQRNIYGDRATSSNNLASKRQDLVAAQTALVNAQKLALETKSTADAGDRANLKPGEVTARYAALNAASVSLRKLLDETDDSYPPKPLLAGPERQQVEDQLLETEGLLQQIKSIMLQQNRKGGGGLPHSNWSPEASTGGDTGEESFDWVDGLGMIPSQ